MTLNTQNYPIKSIIKSSQVEIFLSNVALSLTIVSRCRLQHRCPDYRSAMYGFFATHKHQRTFCDIYVSQ